MMLKILWLFIKTLKKTLDEVLGADTSQSAETKNPATGSQINHQTITQ